jgi:hypothetical protein
MVPGDVIDGVASEDTAVSSAERASFDSPSGLLSSVIDRFYKGAISIVEVEEFWGLGRSKH